MAASPVSFYLHSNCINVSEDQGLLTVWGETHISDTVLFVVLPLWTINCKILYIIMILWEQCVAATAQFNQKSSQMSHNSHRRFQYHLQSLLFLWQDNKLKKKVPKVLQSITKHYKTHINREQWVIILHFPFTAVIIFFFTHKMQLRLWAEAKNMLTDLFFTNQIFSSLFTHIQYMRMYFINNEPRWPRAFTIAFFIIVLTIRVITFVTPLCTFSWFFT